MSETDDLVVDGEEIEEIVERTKEGGEPIAAVVQRRVDGELWEFRVEPSGVVK